MSIVKERVAFKPFEYQWAYDFWFQQQNAHWLHTEINMQSDVIDWNSNLNEKEKNVIGNILKGFTQTETEVGNYWSSLVPTWFPVPEIKMMAQTFGAFETIHATAYSYLNDTLGLTDFEAFLEDEATMAKLGELMKVNSDNPRDASLEDKARSLALFSAAAEGINLFSSFAVLLSFKKSNRLKGISQQMEFSIRDESLHSTAGCKLFRVLVDENPHLLSAKLRSEIYHGIDLSITNEMNYIEKIFELGDLDTINKAELKNFILDRANRKLKELGLSEKYIVDKELLQKMNWFYIYISGEQQTDFFDNRETGYSKPNDDWNSSDLF